MKAIKTTLFYIVVALVTAATILFFTLVIAEYAHAQGYQPYTTQQIIRQPMYTAPGQSPLILPPTNSYAPAQAYIQGQQTQQVRTCTMVPNGNGGYIQRCW